MLLTAWWWIVDGGLCNGLPWWPDPDIVAVVDPLEFCPGWWEWWRVGWSGAREMPGGFDMANGWELTVVGPLASNRSAFIISTIILWLEKQIRFSFNSYFKTKHTFFNCFDCFGTLSFCFACYLLLRTFSWCLSRFPPSLYIIWAPNRERIGSIKCWELSFMHQLLGTFITQEL